MANESGVRPGWYADPIGRFELRYFNGTGWTADVSQRGQRFVDPHGIEPTNPEARTNSAATAAMVSGIIAVAISWLPFIVVLGVIAAVLALGLGWVGVRRADTSGIGRSRAIVGIVTGAGGLVGAALGIVLTVIVLDVYRDYIDPGPHQVSITECRLVGSRATAAGVIENLGDDTADYSVIIGFAPPGTDTGRRLARAIVDDVAPGERTAFEVERQVDLEEVDCVVVDVTGALPFGLEID